MIEEDAKDRVDTRRWITCCGKKKIKKILEAGVSPEHFSLCFDSKPLVEEVLANSQSTQSSLKASRKLFTV